MSVDKTFVRALLVSALLSVVVPTDVARAQPTDAAQSEAKALLIEGSNLYKRERYDEARVRSLIDALELERSALDKEVRTLSKGMTQKLGLAGCFVLSRDLYVLDEPMSGLDPAARVAVKSLLRRAAGEGRTLFFTSHVLADVEELCGSIAVLERGRVRFRGTPAALCERYRDPNLERAFMNCIRDEHAAAQA